MLLTSCHGCHSRQTANLARYFGAVEISGAKLALSTLTPSEQQLLMSESQSMLLTNSNLDDLDALEALLENARKPDILVVRRCIILPTAIFIFIVSLRCWLYLGCKRLSTPSPEFTIA
jgi:hypothetical protein